VSHEVRLQRDGRVAIVTIDRPSHQNRLTREVLLGLEQIFWMAAAILLALAGCAGPSARWSKPGATGGEITRDHTECLNEATYTRAVILHRGGTLRTTEVDYDGYERCMRARGYQQPRSSR